MLPSLSPAAANLSIPSVSQGLQLGSSTPSPGGLPSLHRTSSIWCWEWRAAHSSFSTQWVSECLVHKAFFTDNRQPVPGAQAEQCCKGDGEPKEIWSLCPVIDYGGSRWVPETQSSPTVLLATWP